MRAYVNKADNNGHSVCGCGVDIAIGYGLVAATFGYLAADKQDDGEVNGSVGRGLGAAISNAFTGLFSDDQTQQNVDEGGKEQSSGWQDAVDAVTKGATGTPPKGLEVTPEQADENMAEVQGLPGAKSRGIDTAFGPGTAVDLPDGTTVIDRPGSKTRGTRTLEVQKSRGTKGKKTTHEVGVVSPAKEDNNAKEKSRSKSDGTANENQKSINGNE